MLQRIAIWCVAVFVLGVLPTRGDSVTINTSNVAAFQDSLTGDEMSPYAGTFDGQAAELFCVDFNSHISLGSSWTVDVTPLTDTSNYANTLQGNETTYLEFAWLIEQISASLSSPTPDYTAAAEYEFALWSFTGGPDPYGTNATLVGDAEAAVSDGFTASDWLILTPNPTDSGQEFMVIATPEPSSLVLLALGVLAVAGAASRSRKQRLTELALQ